jgi:hypothetical protein
MVYRTCPTRLKADLQKVELQKVELQKVELQKAGCWDFWEFLM